MPQPKFVSKTPLRSKQLARRCRALGCLVLLAASGLTGCQSMWEQIRGPGFTGWTGNSVRGNNPDAKPSGFFTSKKADQIEQNLGGDFE